MAKDITGAKDLPGAAFLTARLDAADMLHWAPVALGLGIGAYFALPVEPPLSLTIGALIILLLVRATLTRPQSVGRIAALGAILAVSGMLLGEARTLWVAGPVIDRETRPLTLTGQIIRVERRIGNNMRLLLRVEDIAGRAAEDMPRRVRLNVRTARPELFPGDRVRMRAILTPPPGPVLPGGYDFARSAWFQKIGALGFSISAVTLIEGGVEESLGKTIEIRVEGLRDAVAARVRAVIDGEAGALAVALVTGLRSGLNETVQENMRGAGLAHLLAISGLHMALVTGALFFGIRALMALSPALALKHPIKKYAAVAAWAGAIFYLYLSGAGISTQRAFIMVSIVLLAVLLDRQAISMRLVALAAILVLVFSPEALLSASFQMSFAAVAGLVAGFEWHQQRFGAAMAERRGRLARAGWYLWGIILATLIAEVTIGPVAAFHFHRVTLFGIPANIIAMPLMSFWIMPWAVLGLVLMPFGLEAIALVPMGWGLEMLLRVAADVAALPGAVQPVPAMPFGSFLLLVTGGLWLVLMRKAGLRRWAVVPLLLAILPALMSSQPDVLIGREGSIFAVRDGRGEYAISTSRRGRFTRKVWLETYGQQDFTVWPKASAWGRGPDLSSEPVSPVRCDPVVCVYTPPFAPASRITFITKREGFAEACHDDGLLVSVHFAPRDCRRAEERPSLVLDGRLMRRDGAMTIRWAGDGSGGEWRIESVADARGNRPWTGPANNAGPD